MGTLHTSDSIEEDRGQRAAYGGGVIQADGHLCPRGCLQVNPTMELSQWLCLGGTRTTSTRGTTSYTPAGTPLLMPFTLDRSGGLGRGDRCEQGVGCSGGRDLSGNKRTNKEHSFDQRFESANEALRVSCRNGYPVRVVR